MREMLDCRSERHCSKTVKFIKEVNKTRVKTADAYLNGIFGSLRSRRNGAVSTPLESNSTKRETKVLRSSFCRFSKTEPILTKHIRW